MACGNNRRHWFRPYGCVGLVTPNCVRCDAPNPRYTPTVEAEMVAMGYGPDWWEAQRPRKAES